MTALLYQTDSYLREFTAQVIGVTGQGVVLDRTAFYPGGGGQPCDTGWLEAEGERWTVLQVGWSEGPGASTRGYGRARPPGLGATVRPDAYPYRPAHPLRGSLAGLRRSGNRREHGAPAGEDGL